MLGYGAVKILTGAPTEDLRALAIWLVAAVVIHDGVVSPAVLGVGWVLARVPPRPRRFAQAGLVVGGMLVVVAAPLIHRQGTQPASKALLLKNYAGNLSLLLVLVALISTGGYIWSIVRNRPVTTTRGASPGEPSPL